MKQMKYTTIQNNFLHDEYVHLRTQEFDRITIRICEVTGNELQTGNDLLDTSLQLEFREST